MSCGSGCGSSQCGAAAKSALTPVTFSSANAKGDCPGVVGGMGSKRGLVVVQEWWGLNDQIKTLATEWFVCQGFAVLVPDLYRGKVTDDREEAGHLLQGLDFPGAVADIHAAAKYLLSHGCAKVGVVGFCMGGALTFAAAAAAPAGVLAAVAPFYGIPDAKYFDLGKIRVPVQAHFGTLDEMKGFSAPDDVAKAEATLKAGGVNYQVHNYNAGHGFSNPVNDKRYATNPAAREVAQKRVVEFFNTQLA